LLQYPLFKGEDMKNRVAWQKNEEGFLLILVILALTGLVYLFNSFLMPIIFSVILTSATYPLFKKVDSFINNDSYSALITTFLIFFLIVVPIGYLLVVVTGSLTDIYNNYENYIKTINISNIDLTQFSIHEYTPLSKENIIFLNEKLIENLSLIAEYAKNIMLFMSKSIINSSMGAVLFISITLFVMYFLYRDGKKIIETLKIISPLHDDYDDLLFKEVSYLSGVLTLSILAVAFLQGLSFAALTFFMDLDYLFIGVAIAVSSFIPIVGAALVWLPLSLYLLGVNQVTESILVVVWGVVVTGFIVDNILRPWVTSKISKSFKTVNDEFNPLDHTLLVILSTMGGLISFGVIGLFLGPILAALSISVFDVFVKRTESATSVNNEIENEEVSGEKEGD
jgi:predicted PurR-regulated permease PerM